MSFFRVELSGLTEFGVAGVTNPIAARICIGYRRNEKDEKYVYGELSATEPVTIQRLVEACGGKADVIPEFLREGIGFKSFYISYGTSGNSSRFTLLFDTVIKVDDHELGATITIAYEKGKELIFGGTLRLDEEHEFDIAFKSNSGASYLFAGYKHHGETTIDLRQMGTTIFGKDIGDNLPALSFKLKDFKTFILFRKPKAGSTDVLFGMGAGLDLKLEEMPMAGPIIVRDGSFSFDEVLVMYAKGAFTKEELKGLNGVPEADVANGLNISAGMTINKLPEVYMLNAGTAKQPEDDKPEPESTTVASLGGETSAKAKWKVINKQLGPVNLQRVGFIYEKGNIVLLLDASMSAAGLGMDLVGLGLGFKLAWPVKWPQFYIDGLGLSYMRDPVRISGMFVRATPAPDEEYSYYGSAQLAMAKFSISGMGAYSRFKTGNRDVSFFIYAMYQGAIGGPAFFFVTGIAAGFGYNRRVNVPKITEVAQFPLVAMALNPVPAKSLNQMLAELIAGNCIPASPGDYWLAVGVKFTTFKILESFILVIVQFGTRTEFAILGLSILAWPDRSNAIAYVELALKASFGPDSEVMSIEAMLTPNSYVLDRNCKLTGGFAFYAWVSGPNEGDFVITLGGYHPRFVKPKHYPDVQRLGLSWKITKELQVKGGLYYALTPSMIMAGGKLEVTYTLSFLKGGIVVWADMLIAWAPFRYAIDIGIRIYIEANIDMGLFYVRFSLEMGAELHIWGPPFAGYVYVDWSIFAFTISFGDAANQQNKPLEWDKFREQFLPARPAKKEEARKESAMLLATATSATEYAAAEIIIAGGIINEPEVDGVKYTIVNPHKLLVKVEAPVPVTKANVGGNELGATTKMVTATDEKTYADRKKQNDLGIRPMGQRTLQSTLGITIEGNSAPVTSCYSGSVPEALWSPVAGSGSNANPGRADVIKDALKGVVMSPAEVPVPAGTPQFDLSGKFDPVNKQFTWQYIAARTGPDNTSFRVPIKDKITEVLQQQMQDRSTTIRNAVIVAAIADQSMAATADSDGDILKWVAGLNADPVIVQVGGLPQYKNETGT